MPKKGIKRGLSKKSADSSRMKQQRMSESSQERGARLGAQKTRQKEIRKNESEEAHSERVQKQILYNNKRRVCETGEETQARQDRNTQSKGRKRKNETEHERDKRLRTEKANKLEKRKMKRVVKEIDNFDENDSALEDIQHELPSLYEADNICPYCKAYRWKEERKGFCCEEGKIDLPHETDMPLELKKLYDDEDFNSKIRSYNNALALASIGCKEEILPGFCPTFKIHGKVFHRIGSLQPTEGEAPKFAQIYFHDNDHETENRLRHNPHLDPKVLKELQDFMKKINPYVKSLVYASEISKESPDLKLVIHADKKPDGEHIRRYNLPTASEVAVIMPGEQAGHLDIILKTKDGEIQHINSMHRSYDPLHYVLLFPYGDDGYNEKLTKLKKSPPKPSGKTQTMQQSGTSKMSPNRPNGRSIVSSIEPGSTSSMTLMKQSEANKLSPTESQSGSIKMSTERGSTSKLSPSLESSIMSPSKPSGTQMISPIEPTHTSSVSQSVPRNESEAKKVLPTESQSGHSKMSTEGDSSKESSSSHQSSAMSPSKPSGTSSISPIEPSTSSMSPSLHRSSIETLPTEQSCSGNTTSTKESDTTHLSPTEFHRYHLQVREGSDNRLMRSGKLTQQYATDSFAKAENQRLRWINNHQKEIKADKYKGLLDAVHANDELNAGRKIILPPTFTGGTRWYAEEFQSSMALVRKYGKPDYFVTFTTNPNWPEIRSSLLPGQHPSQRPDICVRVFNIKNEQLLDDFLYGQVLGEVIAYCSMKEDQKRGLPHSHTLLIMAEKDKPRTPEQIDRVVFAEIPDANVNPKLHAIVTKHMIHGPCGAVNDNCSCMQIGNDGKKRCSKDFPREFEERTRLAQNGYPKYRRRTPEEGGNTHTLNVKGEEFKVDNSWVVPYNAVLSLRYNAHLNVEVVTSIECVKYICKYTCKGSDRVVITLANGTQKDITNDEVQIHQNGRYISASEAYYRLYEFLIAHRYPSVEKLPLHLEDEQLVYFQTKDARTIASKPAPVTKLTAYFKLYSEGTESRPILYPDIYQYYTWDSKNKKWVKRAHQRSILSLDGESDVMSDTVGRIPIISLTPAQSEMYFLRMLLYHKAGAKGFADLRTVNGVEQPTYQEACLQMGILDDDSEIDKVLEEAASVRFGPQLREVFATLLIWVKPADPKAFWEKHQMLLCEDLLHRDGLTEPTESVLNEVLLEIQEHIERNGLDLETFRLPKPDRSLVKGKVPKEILEETSYDTDALKEIVEANVPRLNKEQAAVYKRVMNSIDNNLGEIIGLDAAGGTGKTFLISTMLASVRARGEIGLGTAISGIAATLIMNGRTLHARCKVPIENLNDKSFCNISKRDATAELIRKCVVLVIDEDTMAHKHVFEAVDRTFRDIREDDRPFGGVTIVLSGDWHQILPVVKRGSRADIVEACLKSSKLWKDVQVMKLTENMRLQKTGKGAQDFAKKLLAIGEGREPVHQDLGPYKIRIDDDLLLDPDNESLRGLCDFVWEGLPENYKRPDWLCSRAVLCPTNEAAEEVNNLMSEKFPGQGREYKSSDKLTNESRHHQYPEEFLNTITSAGIPPHKLNIKKGCPIMLLRNLDPIKGHCNGTRYIVNELHDHVLDATVATGVHVGRRVFIPRIPMTPSDASFPFQMIRRQFPVRVCFGMTSNKSQGQELEKIGIYLKKDFFSHGQLYVALSRARKKENVRIFSRNGCYPGKDGVYTDNIVFQEVLS